MVEIGYGDAKRKANSILTDTKTYESYVTQMRCAAKSRRLHIASHTMLPEVLVREDDWLRDLRNEKITYDLSWNSGYGI